MLQTLKETMKQSLEEASTKNSSRPLTNLPYAVPAEESSQHTTHITIHSHRIVIERQDSLYKIIAVLESVTLIAASLFMISLSATSIIFALNVITGNI